ncbi:uncharacterized protein LOC106752709 [Vigna radiata var. radiata]|uniref:Uncharacterized protein LOC106752709 n=1 Tax=Vigna radiata var. radiata TaxID=3916 RepID=A0A1S3T847_VIGRR|nr:uncharacterized protein LOC106752709 [Vigna radiata var. radiata]
MDQINNPSSPYYLYPGENPGISLISQVLDESNYTSWSRNMRRALFSKNKLKFIDGGIKKPQREDPLFDSWERSNMMVLSWIIKTLSAQIAESVVYVEDAQELWEELKERFSKGDHFKFSDLLQEIHSIKQGERSVNHRKGRRNIIQDILIKLISRFLPQTQKDRTTKKVIKVGEVMGVVFHLAAKEEGKEEIPIKESNALIVIR